MPLCVDLNQDLSGVQQVKRVPKRRDKDLSQSRIGVFPHLIQMTRGGGP